MSDLFHRLNPFGRPPSPTKPSRTLSPGKKLTKSPHHLHLTLQPSRPDSAGAYLACRPSSSLESPLPDITSGRYLFDTQQSIDLDRPVFTPDQAYLATTPGRKARTPSILRTLAHHPSLSALKSRSKRDKKKEDVGEDENREERLSESLDEEVPVRDDEDHERRGWMGTWGSAKKKRARKGSLKAVKSMPSVRSSGETDEYRPSIDAPVPALPEMYIKTSRSRGAIDFSQARAADIEISLEGYETPVSPTRIAPRTSISPSPILRIRGQSVDLSPRRQTALPRHLSTPANGKAGYSISPPRLSLPSTTQHPHPVPLEWDRRTSVDIEDYDASNYGDRPRTPNEELDDGLDLLHQAEDLPHGTPGGTKEDKQKGILSDVAKHEKGSIRFFSRDTYARLSESPASTPCPTPSLSPPVPTFSDRASRSESPFEVMLSPMVSKRISLDAFGLSTPPDEGKRESMQSVPESIEEMEDEGVEGELDQNVELDLGVDMVNTLEGWTGTQLTTIDESPSSTRSAAYLAHSTPTTSATPQDPGRTSYYTPESRSHPSSPLGYSPLPSGLSRQLIEAHTEHTRALDAQVRENAMTIDALQKEVEMLKKELEDESSENEAAWKVVDEMQGELKKADSSAEERCHALEQMRQAMVENEDYFEQLQDAHDNLTERVKRMDLALSHSADIRDQQAAQIIELTRVNSELPLALAAIEQEKAELRNCLMENTSLLQAKTSELDDVTRQLEVTVDEFTSHMASCEIRNAEMAVRVSEVDTLRSLLSLRESELETCRLGEADMRAEAGVWERKLAEKDMVVQQLRDKVGTKQFEVDEGRVRAEGEIRELKEKLREIEAERDELAESLRGSSAATDQSDRIRRLELEAVQLEEEVSDTRFLLEEAQDQLESTRSELEARDGDVSLQQGEVKQTRAELEAANESFARLTAQSNRVQREHDRNLSDLQWQLDTLRTQLAEQESQTRTAFVEREMSSATTLDAQSRLTAYLSEIDRLTMSEITLRSEVADLRAASAGETLKMVDLEKRVRELGEDKELMDISLDNKETEITLLQRQASRAGGGNVTPTRKRLGSSLSRIPSTPVLARPGETPGGGKRLSVSTYSQGAAMRRPASAAGSISVSTSSSSSTILKMSRRESLVISTPKPKPPTPALPQSSTLHRQPSITTPTPSSRVLGSTTKHNRPTPKPTGPRKSTAAVAEPTLKRQTSIPSIARASSGSKTGHRALDGMAEMDERGAA